jgi:hypothetical protein
VKRYQDDEILNFYINLYVGCVFLLPMICSIIFFYFFLYAEPFEVALGHELQLNWGHRLTSFQFFCTHLHVVALGVLFSNVFLYHKMFSWMKKKTRVFSSERHLKNAFDCQNWKSIP